MSLDRIRGQSSKSVETGVDDKGSVDVTRFIRAVCDEFVNVFTLRVFCLQPDFF